MGFFTGSDAASGAQTGGNILVAWLNHKWQKEQLAQNEEWARQDATTAYNRMIEQWNRENAYNTPAAQMQRALAAGLNPNLFLAQQGLGNGAIAAPAVPQAATQGGNSSQIAPDVAGSLLQGELIQAQIDRLQNQNQNDTLMTRGQLMRWASENHLSFSQAQKLQSDVKVANKTISKMDKEIALLDEDIRVKAVEAFIAEETRNQRVEQIMAETKMSKIQAEKFARMQEAIIAEKYGNAHQSEATANQIKTLTPAEKRLKEMMAAYYMNSANKTLTENDLLELDRQLKEAFGADLAWSQVLSNLSGGLVQTFMNWADFGGQKMLKSMKQRWQNFRNRKSD